MANIPTHASYLADVARAAHQTGKDLTLDDVAAVIEAVNSLAAPGVSTVEDAQDDSIALDKLADYIADTWPDKKYGLEEICQRLHAMWPGEFIPLEVLGTNEPNVREALRAVLIHWKRFQSSDGNQQDAYNLLVKGARHAWQFAEAEINRVPAPAPAAGDAQLAAALMPKLQSLLDRMANDPRTGAMFEADGDTLRDAMHLCRSVNVCAALAAQRKGDA